MLAAALESNMPDRIRPYSRVEVDESSFSLLANALCNLLTELSHISQRESQHVKYGILTSAEK
jgi:hypothetical protein